MSDEKKHWIHFHERKLEAVLNSGKKKDKGKTVYAKFKDGKCTFDFRP